MRIAATTVFSLSALLAAPMIGAQSDDPFADPIPRLEGVIEVDVVDVAVLPAINGDPADMRKVVHEPGTERLFVNDQRGPLYILRGDGTVIEYLNVNARQWGVPLDTSWREVGVQSFAIHPEFAEQGAPGHGKLYFWADTVNTSAEPDFVPDGGDKLQHTVLLEFTAEYPGADRYDGGAPRELFRLEQPFRNHNGGDISFNPLASSGDEDYGLLYVGIGDGGSGGDPLNMAQNLSSGFGKILRIDPLGSDGRTGGYGIPPGNPFADDDDDGTLAEIYASGLRNPQHFAWDPVTGAMFTTDIGQNVIEELSPVTAGADLGWNVWEGSARFERGTVSFDDWRGDSNVTYPIAEYEHTDPLFTARSAATGLVIYRDDAIPDLENLLLFGDLVSGEIFYLDADSLPAGGKDELRRVLLRQGGEARTLLELVQAKNREQGRAPSDRTDLRLFAVPDGRIFVLNKHDGTLRAMVGAGRQ